jgi:hypothetical protein
LSEIDQEISSGRRPIGFIKCDVEGFEASVFAGLQKTLTNHSPIIVFESDERGAGAEAFAILKQCGYRHLYVIRETGDEIKNRFRRELKRLASSYQFWLEELDDAPGFWANVVVTKRPLT